MSARWIALSLAAIAGACQPAPATHSVSPPSPAEPASTPAIVRADAAVADAASAPADALSALPDAADDVAPTRAAPRPEIDFASAPRSKIALIDALDRGLRSGDRETLLASVPDASGFVAACRGWDASAPSVGEALLACETLGDWKLARRAVLNFGTRRSPYAERCPGLERLEKSELFYAVGDEVWKVTLHAVALGGGHAAFRVQCVKKGGSARDVQRFRENCPGRAWSRVTQSGGRCP
jgi:hypothetical protein